jgi:protein-disulfide isomerase
VQAGKLRYVVREFPIESIHPRAFKASEAALCAGEQNRYWEMHDRIFANPRALAPADLAAHASALGVDRARFDECLASGRQAEKVRRDLADGQQAGVQGTPTFFLGTVAPGSPTLKVVRVLRGAQPFASFKAAIDAALSAQP